MDDGCHSTGRPGANRPARGAGMAIAMAPTAARRGAALPALRGTHSQEVGDQEKKKAVDSAAAASNGSLVANCPRRGAFEAFGAFAGRAAFKPPIYHTQKSFQVIFERNTLSEAAQSVPQPSRIPHFRVPRACRGLTPPNGAHS